MAERRRRGTDPADDRREEELSAEDAAIEDEFADELDEIELDDDFDGDVDDADGDTAVATKSKDSKSKSKDLKDAGKKKTKVKEGGSNNIFARLINFVREVVAELRKVIWPTRKELTTYTLVVVVFVIVMLSIVGGLDYLFAKGVLWAFGNKAE